MRLNTVNAAIGRVQLKHLDEKNSRRRQIVENYRKELFDNEIGSAIYYEKPIHMQEIYQEYGLTLPNSEKFSREIMSLPSYPSLTDEQVGIIAECVNKIIN